MSKDLKSLAPPEKKVVAKVLYNMGWSSRKIEQWIKMDNVSVIRASEQPTPDALKQFETEFVVAIQSEKQHGVILGLTRLNELLPKEKRVSEVVKGLEYLEGKNIVGSTVNVNTQINLDKYVEDA